MYYFKGGPDHLRFLYTHSLSINYSRHIHSVEVRIAVIPDIRRLGMTNLFMSLVSTLSSMLLTQYSNQPKRIDNRSENSESISVIKSLIVAEQFTHV